MGYCHEIAISLNHPVEETALRLDNAGNPVIAYHDIKHNFDDMKLAHCGDPNCNSTVTPVLLDSLRRAWMYRWR